MAVSAEFFRVAMASLGAGVTVITARRADGGPCGLTATSTASYSATPPSLIISISHSSRCHDALAGCERFGVHLLGAGDGGIAAAFASRSDDKFACLSWCWDAGVPRLDAPFAYLRCRLAATFVRYDHSILIGDVEAGRLDGGEPLLYVDRRWGRLMPVRA